MMFGLCDEIKYSTTDPKNGECIQRNRYSSQESLSDNELSSGSSLEMEPHGHRVKACFWAESSIPKQNSPREEPKSVTKTPLPPRYRKMKLRSHDEILQEQYDALRKLLDDKQNLSRKQLREQHVSQTLTMIGNYREMNKGARARSIIISQSLPQALRSPRSSSRPASAISNRSQRRRSASQSSSPDRRDNRKVTFRPLEQHTSALNSTDQTGYEGYALRDKHTHSYLDNLPSPAPHIKGKRQKRPLSAPAKNETHVKVLEQSPREKPGIYEDINGVKHSDFDLKRTNNPDIKHWIREKEKLIRRQKKEKRELKKKEAETEEKKVMEMEQRKLESAKKVKEWKKLKRKAGLMKRRKQQSQRKLETKPESDPPTAVNKNQHPQTCKETTVNNKSQQSTASKPPAPPPSKPSPQSAPLRRSVKPQPVSVDTLIKNNPDLREKLRNLEREKKLKHRQSYEEWCKIKDSEKRDTLKIMREQRKKLEKEISEETARVISEAARRRIDGIRYKAADQKKEEETDNGPEQEAPKPATYPSPYSWKPTASNNRHEQSTSSKDKMAHSMQTKNTRKQTKPTTTRNIEDKINPAPNPYRDTFNPPKLRRPKSKLEQSGINGPDFAEFIWKEVNEEAGNRPEPQGADSVKTPRTTKCTTAPSSKTQPPPTRSAASPTPKPPTEGRENKDPVIETASRGGIFSMTSVDVE